jgi:hypothetical protein
MRPSLAKSAPQVDTPLLAAPIRSWAAQLQVDVGNSKPLLVRTMVSRRVRASFTQLS